MGLCGSHHLLKIEASLMRTKRVVLIYKYHDKLLGVSLILCSFKLGMVVHAFNPTTHGQRQEDLYEYQIAGK